VNQLSTRRRAEIITALCEGNSRATCRISRAAKWTVVRLLVALGRHGGKLWLIDGFSSPPDAMKLVEAVPPPGIEVLDFDQAGSWHFMSRDQLNSGTARCTACDTVIIAANTVRVTAATGEAGAVVTCPRCDNLWIALLDRH
jgi:hypothetical protein